MKLWKRIAAVTAAAFLCLSSVGCTKLSNIEFVLTTGLSGNQLFKVGKSVCTLPEAMIYLNTYEKQYEEIYGVEMWEQDFGGITLEEYVKNNVVSQLAAIKTMNLMAKQYKTELTADEKEKVQQAADEYFNSLSDEEKKWMDLSKEDAANLFASHLLAQHVYEEITKGVNTEISDNEARIITVQQILLKTTETGADGTETPMDAQQKDQVYQKAKQIEAQIAEGEDFGSLASKYNQDTQLSVSFGRGEKEETYEEAAFALDKEEISSIFETSSGYCILKCVENFDREATDANKLTMLEKRKDAVFQEAYDALIADTPSEFNKKVWEKVHLNGDIKRTGKSFFEVYESCFTKRIIS